MSVLLRSGGSGSDLMKEDDTLLRDTFLGIIRHHTPKLASKVDVIYALSQAWVMTESDADFEMLEKRLSDLNPDELILVCNAAIAQK